MAVFVRYNGLRVYATRARRVPLKPYVVVLNVGVDEVATAAPHGCGDADGDVDRTKLCGP
jgi:hypothetical protein